MVSNIPQYFPFFFFFLGYSWLFSRGKPRKKLGFFQSISGFFPSYPQGIFSLPLPEFLAALGAEIFLWKKEKRGENQNKKVFFFLRMFRVWRFGIFTSFAALWRFGKAPGRGSRKTGQHLLLSSGQVYFYFSVLFFLLIFHFFHFSL